MGRPKLALPFGDELLLQRVARIVASVVQPVVVVAAADQELPALPPDVCVLRDQTPHLGPLAGMQVGLEALARHNIPAAYVSACDTPLLKPELIRALIARLGDHELVVPREGEFHHPLAGVYRTSLAPRIQEMVAHSRLRPLFLIQESNARTVDVETLRAADPHLDSLRNANTPEEFATLLARAGL
jgi:molybdopterin-guanine dinucleotide biosynthesis protein A